ncbi:tail fiber assembly protein [Enterobacteriaceae bacterium 4M9]|nr:tail fiber assembly protein [Enterobacteriaceae bacterium 4M9]
MKPVFDGNGIASKSGYIRSYYYDTVTKEYMGWSDEFINVGVSMPGCSTDIAPIEQIPGIVAVFNENRWEQKEDHRDETVYSTTDGEPTVVDYIGPIKEDFTTKSPNTAFDKWNGNEWVTDEKLLQLAQVAENETKKLQLRSVADVEIEWRQDAVNIGIATNQETKGLEEWKEYRVLLMRVDPTEPLWPLVPTE